MASARGGSQLYLDRVGLHASTIWLQEEVCACDHVVVGGVETVRGIGYQHAHAVLTALEVLSDETLGAMRVEGVADVMDIEVHGVDGVIVLAKQVKIRQQSDTWGKQELLDVLSRWAQLELAEKASFEFVTDGRLGPTGEAVRLALEAAACGARTQLAELLGDEETSTRCVILSRARVRQETTGVEPVLLEAEREVRAMLPGARTQADAEEEARNRVDSLFRLVSTRAGDASGDARLITRQEISDVLGGLTYLSESQRWPGALRENYCAAVRRGGELNVAAPRVFPLVDADGSGVVKAALSVDLSSILGDLGPAILAGPTGAGKSTAAAVLRNVAATGGRALLVAHAEAYVQGRIDALAADAISAVMGLEYPMVTGRQIISDPNVTLLIDGVSEIPAQNRVALQVELRGLAAASSAARIVLVGRDIAVVRSTFPSSVSVASFVMAGIGEAERQIIAGNITGSPDLARQLAAQAVHALDAAAENPMLFTLALQLMLGGVQFEDRFSMYTATITRLAQRGGATDIDLTSSALGVVFSRLLDDDRRYANPFEWYRLLAEAGEVLGAIGIAADPSMIDESTQRSGVIVSIGYTQTRAALHDSYADYFAGLGLARGLSDLPDILTASDEQRILFCVEGLGLTRELCTKVYERGLPFLLVRMGQHDRRGLDGDAPARVGDFIRRLVPPGRQVSLRLWRHQGRVVAFMTDGDASDWITDVEGQGLLHRTPAVVCDASSGELALAVRLWRLVTLELLREGDWSPPVRPRSITEASEALTRHVTDEVEQLNRLISFMPLSTQETLKSAVGSFGMTALVLPEQESLGSQYWPVVYSRTPGIGVEARTSLDEELENFSARSTVDSFLERSPHSSAADRLVKAINALSVETWINGFEFSGAVRMQEASGPVDVWVALAEQARLWRQAPIVDAMRADLPKNRVAGDIMRGVSGTLQTLVAAAASLMSQPLYFGSIVPALLRQPLIPSGIQPPALEMQTWLEAAQRVQLAHRVTISWYRSRLEGYPHIVAPQLAPGSVETTEDWSQQLAWTVQDLRAGLQFMSAPPSVPNALGASGHLAHQLGEAARRVLLALEASEEWLTFKASARGLGAEGKSSLLAARRYIAGLLAPEAEGMLAADSEGRRVDYRKEVVSEAISNLRGDARTYAEAFGQVNDLILWSTATIFGRLTMYNEPLSLPVRNLDFHAGDGGALSFEVDDIHWWSIECGGIVYVDDPLVRNAVQIEAFSMSMTDGLPRPIPVLGRVIFGTSSALRRVG